MKYTGDDFTLESNMLTIVVEFSSDNSDEVGKALIADVSMKGKELSLILNNKITS